MIEFGFEREFFIMKGGTVQLVPNRIPHDGGLLAEARGKPHSDPIEAAFSLMAETYRITSNLPEGMIRSSDDCATVSPELRIQARRSHTKDLIHYQNLYGHERHPIEADEMTAGVHVSVTRGQQTRCAEGHSVEYNGIFDFARFVKLMDKRFEGEITKANRFPGFYEIKSDGRVEYRSLPQSIDILEVAEFLKANVSKIHGSW